MYILIIFQKYIKLFSYPRLHPILDLELDPKL